MDRLEAAIQSLYVESTSKPLSSTVSHRVRIVAAGNNIQDTQHENNLTNFITRKGYKHVKHNLFGLRHSDLVQSRTYSEQQRPSSNPLVANTPLDRLKKLRLMMMEQHGSHNKRRSQDNPRQNPDMCLMGYTMDAFTEPPSLKESRINLSNSESKNKSTGNANKFSLNLHPSICPRPGSKAQGPPKSPSRADRPSARTLIIEQPIENSNLPIKNSRNHLSSKFGSPIYFFRKKQYSFLDSLREMTLKIAARKKRQTIEGREADISVDRSDIRLLASASKYEPPYVRPTITRTAAKERTRTTQCSSSIAKRNVSSNTKSYRNMQHELRPWEIEEEELIIL